MPRRRLFCPIAIATLLLTPPLLACMWDHDTLMMERQRFPTALELITGKFLRHSPAYYQWRIEDRKRKLQTTPRNLRYYDDLAVAYDKLEKHDEAIETIRKKDAIQPGLYETEANLGTFLIHSGRLEEGLAHIREAIKINPDAHFGREIYQQLLVEYVLSRTSEQSPLSLPLNPAFDPDKNHASKPRGFARFVLDRQLEDRTDDFDPREAELRRAIKGVLGMMRFGNYDSPVLLEALGDLLSALDWTHDGKRLAARAYLKASYEAKSDAAQAAYRHLAKVALQRQTVHKLTYEQLTLERLEATFQKELQEARRWHEQIVADEKQWIAAGLDVDAEFARKYYTPPTIEYRDPAAARADLAARALPYGIGLLFLLFLAALAASGYGLYRLQRRWFTRPPNTAAPSDTTTARASAASRADA